MEMGLHIGNLARVPNCISSLNTAEFIIRRELMKKDDASPFLAHCVFEPDRQKKLAESYKTYLQGNGARVPESFRRWPLVAVWSFANVLSKDYGAEGEYAVYRVLEDAFGVVFDISVRPSINTQFRLVCRKYGLCLGDGKRFVNDYLVQSGIAEPQLHHVAKAFLFAERTFGPAPEDSTPALNSWEDDATHFLPPGVHVPGMVLEADETAHYAHLFTRFRRKERSRNPLECKFFEELSKAKSAIGRGQHRAEGIPRPSLVWAQNGLALALPKVEGRLTVSIGQDNRHLRGGQTWPLPTPWPEYVGFGVGDHRDRIVIFERPCQILVFDRELGRRVGSFDPTLTGVAEVDARDVVVVSSHPFSVDGEPSFLLGSDGYASCCILGGNASVIKTDKNAFQIKAKPKPRIWVDSGAVAKGARGTLLSEQATFGIEFGDVETVEYDFVLTVGAREQIIPIAPDGSLAYAIHELKTDNRHSSELAPIQAELRLRNSRRALVRQKWWLWPGLRDFKDGIVFESDGIPPNFCPDRSRHIARDSAGHLCLDADTAYEQATLSFNTPDGRVDFDLPRPGIGLSLTTIDGKTIPLRIGDPLVLRDEDKGSSLILRCPNKSATLNVRGRHEPQAFRYTSTRVLAAVDLMTNSSQDEITIEGAERVSILLTRIVPAACPSKLKVEDKAGMVHLGLMMPIRVDAIRLSLEDTRGQRREYDCALMHRQVEGKRPSWLNAKLDDSDFRQALITIDRKKFPEELSLAYLSVRPYNADAFRPLRNLRGDNYAVAIGRTDDVIAGSGQIPNLTLRYLALNNWMSQCFSLESWRLVQPYVQPQWETLGKALAAFPEGQRQLLVSAHLPASPGAAKTWVPLAHPFRDSSNSL